MKLLSRYLLRELGAPLAVCVAALYLLLFAMQFLRASDVLLGSSVTLRDVAEIGLYLTPHFLVMCLPVAFLLALLLGLGRMNEDREWVALQALGVSPWQLLKVPAALGVALGALMLTLGFTGEPWGLSSLELRVNELIKRNILGDVKAGTFYEEIPDFTLYVSEPDPEHGAWRHVLLHDDRDSASPLLVLADEGHLKTSGYSSALELELDEGQVHVSDRGNLDYTVLDFHRGEIAIGLVEMLFRRNWRASGLDGFTPQELLAEAARAKAEEDARPLLMAFHARIAQAFAPVAFAALGAPLALSRRHRGRARGFGFTLVAYVAYYVLSKGFQNLGVEGRLPVPLAGELANLLFAAAGAWALWRARRAGAAS